jgi:hypothetical protein
VLTYTLTAWHSSFHITVTVNEICAIIFILLMA